jgi:hypothetical protein
MVGLYPVFLGEQKDANSKLTDKREQANTSRWTIWKIGEKAADRCADHGPAQSLIDEKSVDVESKERDAQEKAPMQDAKFADAPPGAQFML